MKQFALQDVRDENIMRLSSWWVVEELLAGAVIGVVKGVVERTLL